MSKIEPSTYLLLINWRGGGFLEPTSRNLRPNTRESYSFLTQLRRYVEHFSSFKLDSLVNPIHNNSHGFFSTSPEAVESLKNESINSFENWRQNLVYTLSLDSNFAPFLADGTTWGKKTQTQPLRGLTDDGETVFPSKPESQFPGAHARVNSQLLSSSISKYLW